MPPLLTPPTGSSPEQVRRARIKKRDMLNHEIPYFSSFIGMQDLEEMMLMEAIRLSLIETNREYPHAVLQQTITMPDKHTD